MVIQRFFYLTFIFTNDILDIHWSSNNLVYSCITSLLICVCYIFLNYLLNVISMKKITFFSAMNLSSSYFFNLNEKFVEATIDPFILLDNYQPLLLIIS